MARLIYSAITSLDGYIEDAHGTFDWAAPDDEVHRFVNDQERAVGTYLYGRRMYETMCAWETDPSLSDESEVMNDYARIWQSAEKVVFSTTLDSVPTVRTRIERAFDPDAIRHTVESSDRDVSVGGPEIAGHALRAGLVDECRLFVAPITVGGGKRAMPEGIHIGLELLDERRFRSGTVYLSYGVRN